MRVITPVPSWKPNPHRLPTAILVKPPVVNLSFERWRGSSSIDARATAATAANAAGSRTVSGNRAAELTKEDQEHG